MLALALTAFVTVQEPARVTLKPEEGTKFPIEFSPPTLGHILVSASINGKRPMRFVLDTGSPVPVVLNRPAAQELGLKVKEKDVRVAGLPGEIVGIDQVTFENPGSDNDLQIDGLEDAFSTDLGPLSQSIEGPIDGILGLPMLRQSVIRLDYQARTLEFFHSGPKLTVSGGLQTRIRFIPERGACLVEVEAGSERFPLTVDTGSPHTVFPPRALEALAPSAVMYSPSASLYGPAEMLVLRTERVKVAGKPVEKVDFGVRIEKSKAEEGRYLLGNDVLSRFRCTFDFKNGELHLESAKPRGREAAPDVTLKEVGGKVQVAQVVPESPAYEAGLREGQVILNVDGGNAIDAGATERRLQGFEGEPASVNVEGRDAAITWTRRDRFHWAVPKPTAAMGIHEVRMFKPGELVIIQMRTDAPAWKAGLRVGDRLAEIDGKPIMESLDRVRDVFGRGGAKVKVVSPQGVSREVTLPRV